MSDFSNDCLLGRIITNVAANSLFALPVNQEFVYVETGRHFSHVLIYNAEVRYKRMIKEVKVYFVARPLRGAINALKCGREDRELMDPHQLESSMRFTTFLTEYWVYCTAL